MEIKFEVLGNDEISDSHRGIFAELLNRQGKVQGDTSSKASRCKFICIAYIDSKAVSIGAIKPKTRSDFSTAKADLASLEAEFEWELGYLFTDPEFQRKGLARSIVNILLQEYGGENIMASTEVSENPGMVSILENSGFKFFGKPWKSSIHGSYLGLFLKFK